MSAPPQSGIRDSPAGAAELRSGRPSSQLTRFVVLRVARMVATILIIVPLTFFLFRAVPGDAASAVIGPDLDPSVAASLRDRFGIDEPLPVQLAHYMRQLAKGDLGVSFQFNRPVTEVIGARIVNTLVLVGPALLLAGLIGVVGGTYAGLRRNSRLESVIRNVAFAFKSAPVFWVATGAVAIFSFHLGWTPTVGMRSPGTTSGTEGLHVFLSVDFLKHLVLPLLLLTIHYAIEPLLTMRASMIGVIHEEFTHTYRAMGLKNAAVRRHTMRNAILPVVTLVPGALDSIIAGSVIIETIFSWPGMGRGVVQAVNAFDYPMMQGVFLLIAILVVVGNAVTDIVYGYLDPRVSVR